MKEIEQGTLTQVKFDEFAVQAVRQRNEEVIRMKEEIPTRGGNIVVYNQIIGGDKASNCLEFTMCKFDGENAAEFIALQLLCDFAGNDLAAKPLEGSYIKADAGDHSILLNPMLSNVGISFQAHPVTENLT